MYQRFVCFKFVENTPSGAIQRHLGMFAALKDTIPQIVSYAGGKTFTGGEGADRYDTAHYVTYKTEEDIDIYFHHPAHQEFMEANRVHWADVLVVDSEVNP
jgi:hypothetical protein